MAKRGRKPANAPIEVTIRDFSGGWNVIDNEQNMTSKYAPVMENVVRGLDGSVNVRQGFKFLWTLEGTEDVPVVTTATLNCTAGSYLLTLTIPGHNFVNGDHITLNSVSNGTLTTWPFVATQLTGRTYGVKVNDIDNIVISLDVQALTDGTNDTATISYTRDTHLLGGTIVNQEFFQNKFVVVGSSGEVVIVDADTLSVTQVWTVAIAQSQSGSPSPWRTTRFASFMPYGGHLVIFNGQDSPLQFDFGNTPPCQYLADPSTGSNVGIPQAAYGVALGGYACLAGDPDDTELLSVSALNTDSVYTGNPAPDDAVDVNTANISNASTVDIIGLGKIRDKLVVVYNDSTLLGSLGSYKTVGTASVHDPDLKDTISEAGAISHRSIVSLGNDVFMCDRVGVPSISQSQVALTYVPERISDLIEPAIQSNISRLSQTTQILKIFAVYNPRERQYMLFMPKYDLGVDVRDLDTDPIQVAGIDGYPALFIVHIDKHGLETGDTVTLSGVSGTVGGLAASEFNREFTIFSVLDKNTLAFNASQPFTIQGVAGGGANVTLSPTTDATVGYVYTYNPKLKIKAWHKMTGMKWSAACRSTTGKMYFGEGRKCYQLGNADEPIYLDYVGDYDYLHWSNAHSYVAGDRVRDNDEVYKAVRSTAPSAYGTFGAYRTANPSDWELYEGNPIGFDWELPWADFNKRMHSKAIRLIQPDTEGTAEYDMQLFVDNIYKRSQIGEYTPARTLTFIGGEARGFGMPSPSYGGGRSTLDQYLWMVPVYCKLIKIRFVGQTTEPLRFVAVSIVYHEGTMHR